MILSFFHRSFLLITASDNQIWYFEQAPWPSSSSSSSSSTTTTSSSSSSYILSDGWYYIKNVNSLSELKTDASGSTAYTIIIGSNISASSLTKVSVGSNKTFIGSYSAHTLYNIHFRNISSSGNNIY